jgi:hypothetical protein
MTVTGTTPAPNQQSRVLVKFNTNDIFDAVPWNGTFQGARLRLYVKEVINRDSGATKNIGAYALTRDWREGSVTWKQPTNSPKEWNPLGGEFEAVPYATAAVPGALTEGWVTWDLTALVRQWRNSTTTNHGVILRNTGTGADEIVFHTRESATTNKPVLSITYTLQ